MALPVSAGKRPTVLTFYGRRLDCFDQPDIEAAQSFAGPITVTLQGIDRTASLHRAVESRDLIGQAKGILVERHGLDPDDAFDRLVRVSQHSNVRLVEVAAWLVARPRSGDALTESRPVTAQRLSGPPQRASASEIG